MGYGGTFFNGNTFFSSPVFTGASNGDSIDPVSGDVVLGNDIGDVTATLLSPREIPMAGNRIAMTGGGALVINSPVLSRPTDLIEVAGDFFFNNLLGASIKSTPAAGMLSIQGSNAQIDVGNEDLFLQANSIGVIAMLTGGGVSRFFINRFGEVNILGSVLLPVRFTNAVDAFGIIDYCINCNGTFVVTLPSAVGIQGKVYVLKNSGVGVVTLTPAGAQTIDGAATLPVAASLCYTIMSDNANWIIISKF